MLCYETMVASLFSTWLVSCCKKKLFRLHVSWTRGWLSKPLKAMLNLWFCYQKHTKNVAFMYHLKCSLTILINVFAFLVRANSKEICEEISFPSFFEEKKADGSILVEIQAWLSRKHAWVPQFFFVNSNSPCKGLLLPRGPNLAQKPLYLEVIVVKGGAYCNILTLLPIVFVPCENDPCGTNSLHFWRSL